MTTEILISDENRSYLPTIFRQLGLTQKSVADAAEVSPASISRFLTEGADRINLRPENLQKLANALQMRFEHLRALKRKSASELDVIKQTDRAAVDAANSLTKDRMKDLEIRLRELLTSGIEDGSQVAIAARPAFPGGPLPPHAINYVTRKADEKIESLIQEVRSPASVVVGPIHGGTTSFLERVYRRAQEIRGGRTYLVHFEAAFPKGEAFTQVDLFKHLFREMGVPEELLVSKDLDQTGLKEVFDRWAEAEWKIASQVVVMIDGLDEVFRNAGAIADPLALTNWFQSLRNRAAAQIEPYHKLILLVALTGTTWSAAHASPYATNAGTLVLEKFSKEEVEAAFRQLKVDCTEDVVEMAFQLFNGQPYLTQLFAWSIRDGGSSDKARQQALTLQGQYEAHWERMKSEIQFLAGNNFTSRRVLSVIAKLISQPDPRALEETDHEIWINYRRGLRAFGLVDGGLYAPEICEFYRNAIQRDGL